MLDGKSYDEEKILELLAQGSEYAFTQLFDHYRARVYGVAIKFLRDSQLAEEIVQETFLKVWQRREGIHHVRNFSGYIFIIARNLVFDSLKKISDELANKKAFIPPRTFENETENLLIEAEYEIMLASIVEKLPPQQKQIFKLARWEHLSHEEIADRLSLSRLTVKTHMAAALRTIRNNLKDHLGPGVIFLLIFLILS